jgi:16S rRNA C967 or C1407 C5-methylase (RsmB/RsmF family)/NOL1/NOP2/fmu family ribosome biogenesis protein
VQKIQAFEQPGGVSVNLHPRKFGIAAPGAASAVLWNTRGLFLAPRPQFVYDPWFHGGAYYVQEAGSQLTGTLFSMLQLPAQPTVLDLCASPGGKSVHLSNLLSGTGVLVSNEPIKSRVGVLQENLSKAGWDNLIVTQADPVAFRGHEERFDVILVDAPCSGEGMFRKSEEAREHWSPDLVRFCAARQQRLLDDVWPALKPGGFLLYSTCTLNRSENEGQLETLLQSADAVPVSIKLPAVWGLAEGNSDTSCWYHWPENGGGEGFFVGVLQKRGQVDESREPVKQQLVKRKEISRPAWVSEGAHLVEREEGLYLISERAANLSMQLHSVRVVHSGTRAGAFMGNKFKPDPELALSVHFNSGKTTPLTLDEALAFLCGDGILPDATTEGWNAVSYQGLPLGWINHLGRRSNNLWPAPWRIRNRPVQPYPLPFWFTRV